MKKIFRAILISLLSFGVTIVQGQSPALEWASTFGGTNAEYCLSITEDDQGNILSTGYFYGSTDFDPGPGQTILTASGTTNAFVTKMDSLGNLIWAVSFGGNGTCQGIGIATDIAGNIYVTGNFSDTVDLDPGLGTSSATVVGMTDFFILKLNAGGNFLWEKHLGGINYDQANAISVNSQSFTITGSFRGTIDVDPGPGISNLTTQTNRPDAFVWKSDLDGNFLWAKSFGGPGYDQGLAIAEDGNGNLYITGRFQDSVDFDPGPGVYTLISNVTNDSYILKLNSAGDFIWAKHIRADSGESNSMAIAVGTTDEIYVAGFFFGVIDLDLENGIQLDTSENLDAFILKLNGSGNLIWAKIIGGSANEVILAISPNATGVYMTGYFNGPVDFDPGPNQAILTAVNNSYDAFVQKLDHNGQFKWVIPIGGNDAEAGNSISTKTSNHITTTGNFGSTVDFDPDSSVALFTSLGGPDIFSQRLKECSPSLSSLSLNACNSIVVNGQTFSTSGNYVQYFQNTLGCDSVLNLSLSIFTTDTTLSLNGTTLTAQAAISYQWLDCDNGYATIPGATNMSFTPPASGNYAVALSQNGCMDTSACWNVVVVGIAEDLASQVKIYPNPNNGSFSLSIPNEIEVAEIEIYDALGRLIWTQAATKGLNQISFEGQTGMYILHFHSENAQIQRKFWKSE